MFMVQATLHALPDFWIPPGNEDPSNLQAK